MFDTVGVLILVVLIALFGFATSRAWTLKSAILKWIGSIIAGLFTLIATLLLVLALIGFYKLNQKFSNPLADIQVAGTPDRIARGARLAHICASCHSADGQPPLSGTNFLTTFGFPPVGTLYAPNLTPSGNIKDWSVAELIRAIREGIHKDGRSLLIMPSTDFRYMSDEDVQAVVACLRSQPATGAPTPTNQFNVLGALMINLVDFRTAQQPVASVSAPEPGTPEYGKYMVDIIGCRACHGEKLQGRVDNGQPGPPAGPNLTLVVPQWTEAQFMTFFNTGTLPSGQTVPMVTLPGGGSRPKMPWSEVRAVATDDELKAMYAYLHSLRPVQGPAN